MKIHEPKQRAAPRLRDGKSYPPILGLMGSDSRPPIQFRPQWMPTDILGSPIVGKRRRRRNSGTAGNGAGPLVGGRRSFFGAGQEEFSEGYHPAEGSILRGIGCLPEPSDRRDSCSECLCAKVPKTLVDGQVLLPESKSERPWLSLSFRQVKATLETRRLHLADGNSLFDSIQDQGPWNTCTAVVATSALAFRMRLEGRPNVPRLSSLFVYNAARYFHGLTGDSGAQLRTTLKALAKLGATSEEMWPYAPDVLLDEMPDVFACQMAQEYRAGGYYRLDDAGTRPLDLVVRLKAALADGLPVCFGLPAHRSIGQCSIENDFVIPLPDKNQSSFDVLEGGHAMLLVGYDEDAAWVGDNGRKQKGAFIVRNSWGSSWGDCGYAFLPYPFVAEALTVDHWVVLPPQ